MIKKLRINFALEVLRSNIQSIRSVTDWSDMMGWDRTEFSRRYSKLHGESAKAAYHRYKLKSINNELSENPGAKYYEIAHNIGFRDEKAFYDYMRYHTMCSPTEYKRKLITSKSNKSS
jgi:transcriptional regulator GlxA family with amidase domain